MNLKKASLIFIIGIAYNIFYKIAYALFPFVEKQFYLDSILSILWLVASFTIILFAYFFLKEFPILSGQIKISLICMIVFTSIIIIIKLPFGLSSNVEFTKRILFNLARILNSLSVLFFLSEFYKLLSEDIYALKLPVNVAIFGYGLGLLLKVIGSIFFSRFLISGVANGSSHFFQIASFLIVVVTNIAIINFLVRFRKVENYNQLK